MRRVLLVLVVVLASAEVQGELPQGAEERVKELIPYRVISSGYVGDTFEIVSLHLERIKKQPQRDRWVIWVRTDWVPYFDMGPDLGGELKYELRKVDLDCEAYRFKDTYRAVMPVNLGTLRVELAEGQESWWEEIVPDTLDEEAFDPICKYLKAKGPKR